MRIVFITTELVLFKIYYDEEDLITISSDEDLEIALDLFRNTCTKIRVY